MHIEDVVSRSPVMPVLVIEKTEHAVPLARALLAGGIGKLEALAGPFPELCFCPSGGITAKQVPDYLAPDNVKCVGAPWLASSAALAAGDWGRITQLARAASG